jgi:CDP-diacylglycerol--glycerol-3-phosphate 3-phosphatidyltransferase
MFPFSQTQETSLIVPSIFQTANSLATAPGGGETTIDWTSGYFGLRKEYKELVLGCKAKVRIVSASPEVS